MQVEPGQVSSAVQRLDTSRLSRALHSLYDYKLPTYKGASVIYMQFLTAIRVVGLCPRHLLATWLQEEVLAIANRVTENEMWVRKYGLHIGAVVNTDDLHDHFVHALIAAGDLNSYTWYYFLFKDTSFELDASPEEYMTPPPSVTTMIRTLDPDLVKFGDTVVGICDRSLQWQLQGTVEPYRG